MSILLSAKDVTKTYKTASGEVHALNGVSYDFEQGVFYAIIGRSGSGKSTFLHILGGLDQPTSGQVLLQGQDVGAMPDAERAVFRRRHMGFVFQRFNLLEEYSVQNNILMPLKLDHRRPDPAFFEEVVGTLGLSDKLKKFPSELSGGQQQRAAIARSVLAKPELIIADEPTGNLDKKTGREILQIFRELHQAGNTIVLITHDPKVAQSAERVIRIEDGQLYENQEVPQDDLPVV